MASRNLKNFCQKAGLWQTAKTKLEKGIWPWTEGVRSRLPRHYKIHFVERHVIEPKPVHYIKDEARWKLDEWGQRQRVVNVPIPVTYPPEADEGLWGGEGVVEGLRTRLNHPKKPKTPRIWRPKLEKQLLYTEILDKHLSIVVTRRTLDQIDNCYGFDFYILKTHEVDLKSKLGMKLKREMLKTLITKSMYPDDPNKREEIYDKYKHLITVSEEEVDWLGLTIEEAEYKQEQIEEEARIQNTRPLKEVYMEQLMEKLEAGEVFPEEKEDGLISKLNPFKKDIKEIS